MLLHVDWDLPKMVLVSSGSGHGAPQTWVKTAPQTCETYIDILQWTLLTLHDNSYLVSIFSLSHLLLFFWHCTPTTMPDTRQGKGGRDGDQPAPDQHPATDTPLHVATFIEQLHSLRDDIFGKIDLVAGSLRSEISSVRDELVPSTLCYSGLPR